MKRRESQHLQGGLLVERQFFDAAQPALDRNQRSGDSGSGSRPTDTSC